MSEHSLVGSVYRSWRKSGCYQGLSTKASEPEHHCNPNHRWLTILNTAQVYLRKHPPQELEEGYARLGGPHVRIRACTADEQVAGELDVHFVDLLLAHAPVATPPRCMIRDGELCDMNSHPISTRL